MHQKGFTIIELIITLAIVSFGIIGVYGAFYPFIGLTSNASLRFTAAYLAQEGLEIARNIRDNNFIANASGQSVVWSDGLLECGLGCQLDYKTGTSEEGVANQLKEYNPNEFLKINASHLYSYDAGTETKFKRKVTIQEQSGTDILKVTALIVWNYRDQDFSYEASGYLYDWY